MAELVAISVRQPWAALLVAGVKTVEIRSWKTQIRGSVLIHAAKTPDLRAEGWARLNTPELRELANLRGGIIGVANLIDCVNYKTQDAFAQDVDSHCNAPEWFRDAGLFGFVFQNARPLAYHACPGRTLFFKVEGFTLS